MAATPPHSVSPETLLDRASVPAARFLIDWAATTSIRTYLITEALDPATVAAEVAEFTAQHGPLTQIRLDLSMRVLTVQGVDPEALITLAAVFGHTSNAPTATIADMISLARPTSGFTYDTAAVCRDRGLDISACAAWTARFPAGSLQTCLAAGCTGPELLGYLAAATLPAAAEVATLAALRTSPDRPSRPAH